jgi:hypothetical protein
MVSGEYIYIDGDDDRYVCIDIMISCMYSIYSFIQSSSLSFLVVMITHEESFNAVIYHHNIYLFHHS